MSARASSTQPLLFTAAEDSTPERKGRRLIGDVELVGLSERQRAAALSALWAAWADAAGWISELTDASGLRRRTKGRPLDGPMPWTRKIGGRSGVNVDLPSGTYSDDTQLRLSVCRSYGPHGFDPETFSAVELTVWPSYALGGGTGSKAAAASMARSGARWSANRPPGYFDAGGNGAAMRAQPHAWHDVRSPAAMLTDVMRDAVSTHGHPFGIVGAALSALAVSDSMPNGGGRVWDLGRGWLSSLLDDVRMLGEIAESDAELEAYWLPNWSHPELGHWGQALDFVLAEAQRTADLVEKVVASSTTVQDGYSQIVEALELRVPEKRGSGLHTTLAALGLAGLTSRHQCSPQESLLIAVNELHTDTDTIATMAGAVLGCRARHHPPGSLLDAEYIVSEAARVAGPGRPGESSFRYPDLLRWEPPKTQSDAVLELDGTVYLAGFGPAEELKEPIVRAGSDFAWQWLRLHTSQTVLAKRRKQLPKARQNSLPFTPPEKPRATSEPGRRPDAAQSERVTSSSNPGSAETSKDRGGAVASAALDRALERVRSSNYDVRTIGMHLAKLATERNAAIAATFGALVAEELVKNSASNRDGRNRPLKP